MFGHITYKEPKQLIALSAKEIEKVFQSLDISILTASHAENLMTPFISTIVGEIFSKTLEKMVILREMFKFHGNYPQEDNIVYKSLRERFGSRDVEDNVPLDDANYFKLQKKINFLMLIWREACQEIKEFGTYLNAQEMFYVLNRMTEDEKELMIKEPNNKKKMIELRTKVAKDKEYYTKEIEDIIKKINVFKYTLEDVKTYCAYELNYLKDYEDARVEQNIAFLKDKENNSENEINKIRRRVNDENLVHELINTFIEESRNDFIEDMEKWMKTYDEEVERRDQEIITIRGNIDKILVDIQEQKKQFEERQKLIEEWQEYMKIKTEKENREARELWAATTLQIWWRFMMKHRKLGPYRKGKKGKDKKKKKKK
ncbi:unnamed protein product [Brassicogethes aeneus]|uniref:Dynein regulatory complex protein 9 n=1 Tax=Brassicogethes aeneus TaxID=1431903 RepID=A0A9P0ATF0_BRAAE|nr:unnamed protein product [Brassicogethes aeneus]